MVNGESEENIKATIQKMYAFMSKAQDYTSASWSAIYIDAFGFGRMTTITKPVFYSERNYLIGVVGIDTPISRWLEFDTVKTE